MRTLPLLALMCGISLAAEIALADEMAVSGLLPGQTDQFAEADCLLRIQLPREAKSDRISWSINSAGRTLAKGTSAVTQTSKANELEFTIQTPAIKEGITLEVEFTFTDGEKNYSIPMRLRTGNPFSTLSETIRDRRLVVYDPAGNTLDALTSLEIPHRPLPFLKKIETDDSILLIGEGVECSAGLMEQLMAIGQSGRRIIVLRPSESSICSLELSAVGNRQLRFAQFDEDNWVPEKLDVAGWTVEGNTPGWLLQADGGKLQMTPGNGPQVWPLVEYQFTEPGECLFVGVPLIANWEATPVPREFLLHLLTAPCAR
ncbi:MAG: hypothetical protein R3C18_26540 [Planctomycetaceae bacterium]